MKTSSILKLGFCLLTLSACQSKNDSGGGAPPPPAQVLPAEEANLQIPSLYSQIDGKTVRIIKREIRGTLPMPHGQGFFFVERYDVDENPAKSRVTPCVRLIRGETYERHEMDGIRITPARQYTFRGTVATDECGYKYDVEIENANGQAYAGGEIYLSLHPRPPLSALHTLSGQKITLKNSKTVVMTDKMGANSVYKIVRSRR